jgi:hypothetical protein
MGLSMGPTGMPISGAPSPEEFKEVWDMAIKGDPPRKGIEGVGKGEKLTKMCFCLYEALLAKDRSFFNDGKVVVGISRDERKQRLSVLYAACNANLEIRRGFLGQPKNYGTGAASITQATKACLQKFSTKAYANPSVKVEDIHCMAYAHTSTSLRSMLHTRAHQHAYSLTMLHLTCWYMHIHTPNILCFVMLRRIKRTAVANPKAWMLSFLISFGSLSNS